MNNKIDITKVDISRIVRTYKAEVRAADTSATDDGLAEKKYTITGKPIVYNSETIIGNMFREVIMPGALDDCDLRDVLLYVEHDMRKIPIARSRRNNPDSTMRLTVDENGLSIEADLDVKRNADASALYSSISRGDMDGMSFSFAVKEQVWEDLDTDLPLRKITKLAKVFEVSVVALPAYQDTSVTAATRSDELALESARLELENARSQSVETDEKRAAELELEKAKALFKLKFL